MLKKERSEILSELPAKQRQVIRIDPKKELPKIDFEGTRMQVISRALSTTLDHKIEEIVDNVIGEIAEGNKVLVFSYLRANAERVYQAIEEKMRSPQVAVRMRQVEAETWLAHGEVSNKGRFDIARIFREYQGAGALVSTVDAMQVGISLKGATSVHFAELHHSPAAMLQAEDRPYEVGSTGLSIVYYIVKGSIDEHIESILLPKFKTQELLTGEEGATDARTALAGADEDAEDAEAIWQRLTRHLG
jgi:SWI/SNF-related matrix-associated actin-dependent regulator 1 of chromatin subfamily A